MNICVQTQYYGFNFMVWQLEDHVEEFDQVPLLALAFHE